MKKFYQEFKTPIVTIVILFVALFFYTKLAGPIPFFINSITTTKTDLFSSDGEGKATAVPDQATVDAGVTQTALTVSDAQDKVNKQTEKIIADVKKLGIQDKDIKTTNYSVNPNYGNSDITPMMFPVLPGRQTITGYTVTQNLEINVKPIDKVNKVIDTATSDGANLVGGANFTFSDDLQKTLEQKARVQAVENAKAKAQSLADAAGIRLGKVINVVENSNVPRYLPLMAAGAAKSDSSANTQTTVTPGENSVTTNVVIYYETF